MKTRIVIVSLAWLSTACASNLDEKAPLAELDEAFFRCQVQPVLAKNCAQLACHGDGQRYFRLFARNRLRLGGDEAGRNALFRDAEYAHNFASARAFVDQAEPSASLLVLKPLDQSAGGYYHGGATEFGHGDVFATADDTELDVVKQWLLGATDDPACIEPGSDQ